MSLPRILLIDDDSEVLDRLLQVVEGKMEIVGASGVDEVLEHLQRSKWDLLLTDVNLLLVRGDRLIELVRERLGGQTPPVVYFSSADESELAELTASTGAAGFLSKGTRSADLLDRISEFVSV
ncbi:MAG: response regulator [Planctomycetes bacterium]|nr:response regulator [Planctomycetota bacterium]